MTPQEQLAKIFRDHLYRNVLDRKYHCQCGEELGDPSTVDFNQSVHVAQVILDAGWLRLNGVGKMSLVVDVQITGTVTGHGGA